MMASLLTGATVSTGTNNHDADVSFKRYELELRFHYVFSEGYS